MSDQVALQMPLHEAHGVYKRRPVVPIPGSVISAGRSGSSYKPVVEPHTLSGRSGRQRNLGGVSAARRDLKVPDGRQSASKRHPSFDCHRQQWSPDRILAGQAPWRIKRARPSDTG